MDYSSTTKGKYIIKIPPQPTGRLLMVQVLVKKSLLNDGDEIIVGNSNLLYRKL